MTNIELKTYRFNKEETGRWYIDIPEWTGQKAELEMVEGADTMLDYVGGGSNQVNLTLSEEPFAGADELKLLDDHSDRPGGGGIYLLETYAGEALNQQMWLCEVTAWVFGKLPQIIYFKQAV